MRSRSLKIIFSFLFFNIFFISSLFSETFKPESVIDENLKEALLEKYEGKDISKIKTLKLINKDNNQSSFLMLIQDFNLK